DLADSAELIGMANLDDAHGQADEPGPRQGAEAGPVPPGEEAQKKRFHPLMPRPNCAPRSGHRRCAKSTRQLGCIRGSVPSCADCDRPPMLAPCPASAGKAKTSASQ